MSSGVGVNDEVVNKYQELKLGHTHLYVIFRMSDDLKEVIVEKIGDKSKTYEDFVKDLPPNDCRYAVYDFEYDAGEGTRNKILFVVWAPESSKIKAKMMYASTKDALRKKLVGIGCEIQATDLSEIDRDIVKERVLRV